VDLSLPQFTSQDEEGRGEEEEMEQGVRGMVEEVREGYSGYLTSLASDYAVSELSNILNFQFYGATAMGSDK